MIQLQKTVTLSSRQPTLSLDEFDKPSCRVGEVTARNGEQPPANKVRAQGHNPKDAEPRQILWREPGRGSCRPEPADEAIAPAATLVLILGQIIKQRTRLSCAQIPGP